MKIKLIFVTVAVFIIAVAAGATVSRNKIGTDSEMRLQKSITVNSVLKEDEDIIKEPLTLEIPKIKVKTDIEYVGLLPNGKMDVPKAYENVAWYERGYYPAERGNAVMSGHVDTPQGERAIFADLNQVEPGDFVIVWGKGRHELFKVYDKKVYSFSEFPLQEVFGKSDERNLNLITCDGEMVNGRYPDRLVVFARKV